MVPYSHEVKKLLPNNNKNLKKRGQHNETTN